MTIQYTTQYSDLYASTEALLFKIKCLGFAIQGLELSEDENEDWIKASFEEIIVDLERHAKAIKNAVVNVKIGGTLL